MSGTWKFDDVVAHNFEQIARSSIPHYEEVIESCVEIASALYPKKDARIVDVGSATGYTLKKLRDGGFEDVWGVDSSAAMLACSCVRTNLIHSNRFPTQNGPFDIVIANWTLHFIKERRAYLEDIREAMRPGGVFILSEKVASSELVHAQYHAFKRSMGLTEEEIKQKARELEGVLVPFPLEWYMKNLAELGFREVEVINAQWCFNTILCRR